MRKSLINHCLVCGCELRREAERGKKQIYSCSKCGFVYHAEFNDVKQVVEMVFYKG